jgi:hypothetical protein
MSISRAARFAVIERSRDFTLGPWWSALEHQIGKTVAGIMRADGINWTIGADARPSI